MATTPARLCIVSNRLPVTVRHETAEHFTLERSSGGLATALERPHTAGDSVWIGWPGDVVRAAAARQRLQALLRTDYGCVPVFLNSRDIQRYYDGFSNGALWPLLHCFQGRVTYSDADWEAYVQVNRQFCEAVVQEVRSDALIWVHDYHLLLLPGMLREHLPEARIGFFLHTPFPPSELFRILPCRDILLHGLLGADLLGFQTFVYRQNFLASVYRVLGIQAEADTVLYEGRRVISAIYPIGIDPTQFRTALQSDPTMAAELHQLDKMLAGRTLLLGMDRLDYSKGIPGRLRAYQRFLAEHPEWRERVTFLQVAVPSRQQVLAYQELRREVEALVGEINGHYGTSTWTPLQYVHRNLQFPQICALLRRADVALVTPLRDGMNLVAKEYVVCQEQRAGALILSEFAGAAAEMGEAFFVNPYSEANIAARLHEVLSLPEEFLLERMQALHTRICTHTVQDWAENFLTALGRVPCRQTARPLITTARQYLLTAYTQATRRVLLLDYDGTLTPLVEYRNRATPSAEVLATLAALQRDERNRVVVVSGRDCATLERWLGGSGCLLVAEHGAWMRPPPAGPWHQMHPQLSDDWKATVRPCWSKL